jgi:flagellar motor switch protein FliG
MRNLNGTLRKVALLVISVDEQTADDLLEQLPSEMAAKVRRAIVELDDIDDDEQQKVIAEFLTQSGLPPGSGAHQTDDGVELAPELERKLSTSNTQTHSSRSAASHSPCLPAEDDYFPFLHQAPTRDLAELLRKQHPQVAAVVLAHVRPEKSAEVLSHFTPENQVSLLRRIADSRHIDREVLRELECQLEQQLAQNPVPLDAHSTPSAGTEIVQAILSAARSQGGEQLLSRLKEVDESLLSRFGLISQVTEAQARGPLPRAEQEEGDPPESSPAQPVAVPLAVPRRRSPIKDPWQFSDIMNLHPRELAPLFQNVDPHSLLAALAGAEPHFIRGILEQLPDEDANRLSQKLRQAQSWQAEEILEAQNSLARVATKLCEQGLLSPHPCRTGSRAA